MTSTGARSEPKARAQGSPGLRATRRAELGRARSSVGWTVLALATLGVGIESASAQVDFNPRGRRRPAAAQPAPPAPAKSPKASASQPARRPPREAASQDPSALIERYERIVLRQPGSEFPLERLVQLYRERDGHLRALLERFEALSRGDGDAARAAQLALAGIHAHAGNAARARELYEAIVTRRPNDAAAATRLARVLESEGELAAARARLDATLRLKLSAPERDHALRSLMKWSLDLDDLEAARRYHRALSKAAGDSPFVRAELGRELMSRGRHAEAEAEYRELLKTARGDSRTLAPALIDLARALLSQGEHAEALSVLSRAEAAVPRTSGLRREILELSVQVHRASDRLPELIARLSKTAGRDFDRLVLLGGLLEESGAVSEALARYRQALSMQPRSISVRLKVVQLLQLSGELDEVIDHYEKLVVHAPHDPGHVFRLAEAHLQRGDRAAAMKVLSRLESRPGLDEQSLAALVDFYERIGERARGLTLLEKLAKGSGTRHLVELGDRYFAQGDTERALETWQRLVKDPKDARALHSLGQVFLDHDMPDRALEALKKALDLAPSSLEYQKSYALALERAGAGASSRKLRGKNYREAQRLWERLLVDARRASDAHLAREARQHIVTLWSLTGTLAGRVATLERKLSATPPDLEAGRLLSETQIRLRRYADAEKTLRRIIEHAPGDVASHAQLERALVRQGRLDAAIEVLKKLAELEPKRAREYYQRMASYASELYQDDRAIDFASRAVELSPDDARGHMRLGEMYRERQDVDRAIEEFRKALSKNDRLFSVHFQLAELLLHREQADEADRLLRRVLRAANDDQLIARAARLSMQIHLGRGSLESLEKELLPIALANPGRPIYRRLLVEVYGALAFPLANAARSPDPRVAGEARERLSNIGKRAVKPLLDALGDARDSQQRIAIDLLSHIQNKGAGPALLTFAASEADPRLRLQAMLAAGSLRDPALRDKLEPFVFADGTSEADPIAVAAAWALSNLDSRRVRPTLLRLLDERAPTVRTLAMLGLARSSQAEDAELFAHAAGSSEYSLFTRAAAAIGLANLGDARATRSLLSLAQANDVVVRATAIASLVRLRADGAAQATAEALMSSQPALVDAAVEAACLSTFEQPGRVPLPEREAPRGRIDVRALLEGLLPDDCDTSRHARALGLLAPQLAEAAARAIQSSAADARSIQNALLTEAGEATFAPLAGHLAEADPEDVTRAEAGIEQIAQAVIEPFVRLASHPAAEMRRSAVRWLSSRSEDQARRVVLSALSDRDPGVQRTALDALGNRPSGEASAAIAAFLGRTESWALRLEALEALRAAGPLASQPEVLSALENAATRDRYALVRHAAARALFETNPERARRVLEALRDGDPEPQVRTAARDLLSGGP